MRSKIYLLCVVFIVIGLFSPSAFGLAPMGPPAAGPKQGQLGIGVEYSYSNVDVEMDTPEVTIGGVPITGLLTSDTIENVASDTFAVKLGLALIDDWEVFLRLGATDVSPDKGDNSDNIAGYIGDSDHGFSIGGGTKITVWKSEDDMLKLGALAQISWASLEFDSRSFSVDGYSLTTSTETELDLMEAQVAFGPTFTPLEWLSIYGGPFFHFISGDVNGSGTANGLPATASIDFEQKSIFGGYVGAQINLGENASVRAEGQFTGNAYAVAVGLSLSLDE